MPWRNVHSAAFGNGLVIDFTGALASDGRSASVDIGDTWEILPRTSAARITGVGTVRFLLDGAHNPAGVEYLIQSLREQFSYGHLHVIWGSMGDKEYGEMLQRVAELADTLYLTRADSERSAMPADLATALGPMVEKPVAQFSELARALDAVLQRAKADDLVVVAGSLYLVGEFRKLLVGEVVD